MQRFDKKELSSKTEAAHVSEIPVRFQDVDAAGIVFFARFFDYVHQAYEAFLTQAGHPLAEVIADKRWAAPLRHAEADYLAPLRFGDVPEVRLVAAHVEESEISLGWVVQVPGAKRPSAIVQTVHAFVSLPEFTRRDVPAEIADALRSIG